MIQQQPLMTPVASAAPPRPISVPQPAQQDNQQLDPQAVAMAKAIRQHESGNRPVSGASGEGGRYQFMPDTWKSGAQKYLGDPNAPMTLENENKVAYSKIKEWKDAGYNPAQIASMWNSGSPNWEGKVGVNKYGVKYDTPSYVSKVYANYQKFKPQEEVNQQQLPEQTITPSPVQSGGLLSKVGNFVKDVARGVVAPIAEVATTGLNLTDAAGKLVNGDVQGANASLDQTRYFPLLGDMKSAFTGNESTGAAAKKIAGYGLEIGSNFVPVGGAARGAEAVAQAVGKDAIKKGAWQIAKQTAKDVGQFGLSGAANELGSELEKGQKISGGKILENAAATAAIPGAIGLTRLTGRAGTNIAKGIKNTISPDVEAALTKAIKPRANAFGFNQSLKTALPDLQEAAQRAGIKVENIDHLDDVVARAKKEIWGQYEGLLGPNANATIDGNKIADAMIGTLDKRFVTQNPQRAAAIVEKANAYRKPMTLNEAEEYLQSANNELHSYYAKNKVNQSVALGDPDVAHVVKEGDALRSLLNNKLGELTGADSAALKKRYGALSTLQSEIAPRKNVVGRQNPLSLAEQLNYAQGVGDIALSAVHSPIRAVGAAAQMTATKLMKDRNTTDNLIKIAFQKMEKQGIKPYARTVSKKFVPAGYLPSPSFMPMSEKTGSRIAQEIDASGIIKNAPGPMIQEKIIPPQLALPSPSGGAIRTYGSGPVIEVLPTGVRGVDYTGPRVMVGDYVRPQEYPVRPSNPQILKFYARKAAADSKIPERKLTPISGAKFRRILDGKIKK